MKKLFLLIVASRWYAFKEMETVSSRGGRAQGTSECLQSFETSYEWLPYIKIFWSYGSVTVDVNCPKELSFDGNTEKF